MTIEQKFMDRVFIMTEGAGCWLWVGKKNGAGYGLLNINGKDVQATRLSLTFFNRPPQPGEFALHKCHNPGCCRPDHLYWGSKKQNTKDQIDRGTFYYTGIAGLAGEDSPNHRFTSADIIEMRRLHWQEGESYADIGRRFHVNSGRVHNICNGKRWGHVKDGLPNPQEQPAQTTTQTKLLFCIAVLSGLRNTLLRCVS